jgi:hypothetical protein
MKVKFKEKTYETFFQSEVARLTNVSFAPDQTDEGLLGFDGSFFVPYSRMPGLFPYVRLSRSSHFIGMPASEIDSFGEELNDRLPPFNLNLFVQYKRPDYMMRSNSAEWSSWSASYYRFSIEDHQQKLLEKIAAASHGRAAVVYASPAFWTNGDLFAHAKAGKIVEHSNIADVALLSGHHRFSYGAAGHFGVGHSEPENIQSEPIESFFQRGLESEALQFTAHMKNLEKVIRSALEGDRGRQRLWQTARDIVSGGVTDRASRTRGTWLGAVHSVIAFGLAFDVRVTAIGVDAGRKPVDID